MNNRELVREVKEYLGSEFRTGHPQKEYKRGEDYIEFYIKSEFYLIANAQHDVPKEIEQVKGKVLDFGGGSGHVSIKLAENNCFVDYIDINKRQQGFVKWIAKKYKLNINVIEEPKKEYDWIILRDVIEHLIDYPTTLKKLFKHLKKDGKIYAKPEWCSNVLHFKDENNFPVFMRDQGFEETEKLIWRRMK